MLLRYVITLALFMHGIGHILFLMNSWGLSETEVSHSWLFSKVLGAGQTIEGIIGLLWLVSLVGFVVVSWGCLTHQGWWPQLALASAVLLLAMTVLWWGGINTSNAFFASVFDFVVIAVVLWQLRSGAVIS